jgi:glycosyltransferase involved in cell wall biosynthesis
MKKQEFAIKICHISTVHPVDDIRIFEKECQVLYKAGYLVYFIVPHDRNEKIRGIEIIALPRPKNRLARAVKNGFKAYRKAMEIKAEVYHFHDPELIPVGFLLSLHGKKVIYDVHEDAPKTIMNKEWIPFFLRQIIALAFRKFENWNARRMNILITATPTIRNRFLSFKCKAIDINNYPRRSEFYDVLLSRKQKERSVCYIGTIDRYRGIVEMTQAVEKTDAKLLLAGTFAQTSHRNLVTQLTGWKKVEELGQLDRLGVARVLGRAMAGLVLIHPRSNYLDSLPIKMFEYMSAGLPVIASDFFLWRKIIEENRCGLCCDPLNPDEIAGAIQWILNHPQEANSMGENGRKAVMEKFNWESEGKKLIEAYRDLFA